MLAEAVWKGDRNETKASASIRKEIMQAPASFSSLIVCLTKGKERSGGFFPVPFASIFHLCISRAKDPQMEMSPPPPKVHHKTNYSKRGRGAILT